MTRRARLERKLEKREQWAAKRSARSDASFKAAHAATEGIPFGQPILVGHHSEKRHRAALDRADRGMRAGIDHADMAAHHAGAAAGIERQLDTSIFSDDEDAVDALTARIAELEAQRDRMVAVNKDYRKGDAAFAAAAGVDVDKAAAMRAKIEADYSWCRQPFPRHQLSNLSGNIGRLRKRLVHVQARAARTAAAEASTSGVIVEGTGDYIRVTFADKPYREVLQAMRDAGYRWGGGSWTGERARLPQIVRDLMPPDPADHEASWS